MAKVIPTVESETTISFELRDTEQTIARILEQLGTKIPQINEALNELTPGRTSHASLSITIGKTRMAEIYIEMQSRDGGVWVDSFMAEAADRDAFIELIKEIRI